MDALSRKTYLSQRVQGFSEHKYLVGGKGMQINKSMFCHISATFFCRNIAAIAVFLLTVNLLLRPAGAEDKTTTLQEIVVTATRTEKELREAPGSVSLVSKEEIGKRNVNSIDELLNTTTGLFDRFYPNYSMDPQITLRGFSSQNRTLILLDGLPLNNAYTGGVQFSGLLSPELLERIEVVKGPFSSLYGSYAMGGVVSFITRIPDKREVTLRAGYGLGLPKDEANKNLRKVFLSYGDRFNDKLSLLVSYGYKESDGYVSHYNIQSTKPTAGITGYSLTTDTRGQTRYLIGDYGESTWWNDNIMLRAKYDLSKTTAVTASFIRSRHEYGFGAPHTYLRDAKGSEIWSYGTVRESSFLSAGGGKIQNLYSLILETEYSSVKGKLSLGIVDQERSWYVSRGVTATRNSGSGKLNETPSRNYNVDLQLTVPIFERHILTLGGTFRYGWADTREDNLTYWRDRDSKTALSYQSKGKDKAFSAFIQDEVLLLSNLTAYLGLRYDWWQTYEGYANDVGKDGYPKYYESRDLSYVSPKVSILYKPFDKTTLRGSIGKAFRAPTVYDLYRTWTSTSGTTYAANPSLKPETTTSWDIGVEQGLWQGAKVKAVYFDNDIKDLIYRKTVSPTLQENINTGKAKSRGIEIEVDQRFEKWLRLFANYTYTDAKVKDNDAKPVTVGKRLIQVPESMFNVGAEIERGKFSGSVIGRYVSKRYGNDENNDVVNNVYTSYDPYFITDAKISYNLTGFATLSVSADNIFNRDYFSYYKAPGRSWFAELTLKF